VVPLNSAAYLTRGNPAGTSALFAHFAPAHHSFIGLLEKKDGSDALLGQIEIPTGLQSAHLTFYLPGEDEKLNGLPDLLDGLVKQAGLMGATNVTAELPENHPAIEQFRRSGFSVYARQRIWRLPAEIEKQTKYAGKWRDFNEMDRFYVHSLYQSLVPPIVQRVEGFSNDTIQGLIYIDRGERYGLVDCLYGLQGIFLQPYIHPEMEDIRSVFEQLITELPSVFDRPVYMAVRSYHAWLERDLSDLGGEVSDAMVLMVKHMGLHIRSLSKDPLWAGLEKVKPQPTTMTIRQSGRK
jgi:hypothetical protein